jgi:DnaJ-class molecular chaperone
VTRIVCFQAYSEEILKVNLVPENAELHQDYCITWLCNPFNKGSKSGASSGCAGCQGSGMKVSIRQLGPGMLQQMRHVCPDCKGSGEVIDEKDKCPQCKGQKVVQDKKMLEVHVEKKITFQEEADEAV